MDSKISGAAWCGFGSCPECGQPLGLEADPDVPESLTFRVLAGAGIATVFVLAWAAAFEASRGVEPVSSTPRRPRG